MIAAIAQQRGRLWPWWSEKARRSERKSVDKKPTNRCKKVDRCGRIATKTWPVNKNTSHPSQSLRISNCKGQLLITRWLKCSWWWQSWGAQLVNWYWLGNGITTAMSLFKTLFWYIDVDAKSNVPSLSRENIMDYWIVYCVSNKHEPCFLVLLLLM